MFVCLEPVYLANILLHVDNVKSIKAFPFASKNCHEAMLSLKVNPASFCWEPPAIIKFFPNINTMVVKNLMCFGKTSLLPNTVTAIVVKSVSFYDLTEEGLKYADRVVEIRDNWSGDESPADFALFPNLKRLRLYGVPERVTLPKHTLKRLSVFCEKRDVDPFTVFPPECAEQVVVV